MILVWEYSSVIGCLPGIHKALALALRNAPFSHLNKFKCFLVSACQNPDLLMQHHCKHFVHTATR